MWEKAFRTAFCATSSASAGFFTTENRGGVNHALIRAYQLVESFTLSRAYALYELGLISPQLGLCHAHRRQQTSIWRLPREESDYPKSLNAKKSDSQVVKKFQEGTRRPSSQRSKDPDSKVE